MWFYFLSFWLQNLPLHFQLGELCAICFPNLVFVHCHWQSWFMLPAIPGSLPLHSTGGDLSLWPLKVPLSAALHERQSGMGGICWHHYLNGGKWCRLKILSLPEMRTIETPALGMFDLTMLWDQIIEWGPWALHRGSWPHIYFCHLGEY